MPTIQNSTSIPLQGVVDNILTGSQWEYLPFNAKVTFGFVGAVVGLLIDAYSGQDILCESMAPREGPGFPINPDDFTLTDIAAAGERLKVRVRNTTGAAIILRWSVVLDQIV